MNVLFLSPQYPIEMQDFTRGLAEVGARVYGIGDSPPAALSPKVRRALADYRQISLNDVKAIHQAVRSWGVHFDRIECLWEPFVLLAAELREAMGIPGMSVDVVNGFRDKEIMKKRVEAAGLRVPHHFRARSEQEIWAAAEKVGYPLIIKPIAGAGSADTYRVDDAKKLAEIIQRTRHVAEVSVEEFVDGEEFTFDTVSIEGRPAFFNIAQYLPRPLVARTNEWISPIIVAMKDVFVNIAGGLKIEDPSLDLAVILSLLSSYEDIPLPQGICFAGEVGLNGEIRAVNRIQQRIAEAEKLGFEKIIISGFNTKGIDTKKHSIEIIPVERVDEAYRLFF
jgi:hypothetical protein